MLCSRATSGNRSDPESTMMRINSISSMPRETPRGSMRTTAVVCSALSSLHKCMFCPITARSNCSALCKLLSLSNYFPTYPLSNSCSAQHLALTLDPRSGEHLLYQCPKRPIFHSYADAALRAIPAPGPFHQLPWLHRYRKLAIMPGQHFPAKNLQKWSELTVRVLEYASLHATIGKTKTRSST